MRGFDWLHARVAGGGAADATASVRHDGAVWALQTIRLDAACTVLGVRYLAGTVRLRSAGRTIRVVCAEHDERETDPGLAAICPLPIFAEGVTLDEHNPPATRHWAPK